MRLSAGEYHKSVPREYGENLAYRRALLEGTRGSVVLRRAVLERCRLDILYFINSFVWQYNPNKIPVVGETSHGPFITWPFQERALLDRPETTGRKGIIWCYEERRTAVVEKSREMGATWLFVIFQDWLTLFHADVESLNISRSAEAVDDGTRKCLFEKFRYINKRLPDWLKGPVSEERFYQQVGRTGSEVTGEASTGRAGAGARGSVIFVDEFPLIKEDERVRQNTASISDCRYFNGTHLGVNTEFYKLTQVPEVVKIQIHWTRHPAKNQGLYSWDVVERRLRFWRYVGETDEIVETGCEYDYGLDYPFVCDGTPVGGAVPGIRSPWYDAKAKQIGNARGVAMELDINPEGSTEQFFDQVLIRDLVLEYCQSWPAREFELDYDHDTGEPYGFVPKPGGRVKLWCLLDDQNRPPMGTYSAGADASHGAGATPSCLTVGTDGGEKVLEFADAHITPLEFAVFCVAVCRMFKSWDRDGAFFCWETSGPGSVLGRRVMDLRYPHIYVPAQEDVRGRPIRRCAKVGWSPQGPAKLDLLVAYEMALRQRQFINRSEIALKECLLFKHDGSGGIIHMKEKNPDDPSGASVGHADRVIADALCWKMIKGNYRAPEVREKEEIRVNTMAWRIQRHERRLRAQERWS